MIHASPTSVSTSVKLRSHGTFDNQKISNRDPYEAKNDSVYQIDLCPHDGEEKKEKTYLGIYLKFKQKLTVKISITGYVDEAGETPPKDVTTSVVGPTAGHMFKINWEIRRLTKE